MEHGMWLTTWGSFRAKTLINSILIVSDHAAMGHDHHEMLFDTTTMPGHDHSNHGDQGGHGDHSGHGDHAGGHGGHMDHMMMMVVSNWSLDSYPNPNAS